MDITNILIGCGILLLVILILVIFSLIKKVKLMQQDRIDTLASQDEISKLASENVALQFSNLADQLKQQGDNLAEQMQGQTVSLAEIKTQDQSRSNQIENTRKDLTSGQSEMSEMLNSKLVEFMKSHDLMQNLTSNVKGLNELLQNRQARGAFSEVILENLVTSILASSQYDFQKQLSNNSRVDCAIILEHEGNKLMCVDSKFPLDAYHRFSNENASIADFKRDVKKHIKDISSKYILHGETHEWAMMFVPSEIIFSTIHSEMTDVVAFSFEHKVAIVSPNTMMATLVTLHAAIRDFTLNKETLKIRNMFLDIIKEFDRFNDRFSKFNLDYRKLGDSIDNMNITSTKINNKLEKVKKAKIEEED
jgi:DNA recombination protein RmuC